MSSSPSPPRLAVLILRRLRRSEVRESMIGDLIEEYENHVLPEVGPRRARRWFWKQTLNVLRTRPGVEPTPASRYPRSKTGDSMTAFFHDIKFAARSLIRTPGFAIVAVLTLALGIGSNTAVYTVVRGVLLKPLPYQNEDALVKIGGYSPALGQQDLVGSPAELQDYRERAESFTEVAAVWALHTNLVGADQPTRISFAGVTRNFFDMLGVEPIMGRVFAEDEMYLGVGTTCLISYDTWQTHFGGDEDIVGRMINIDGDPVQIVGVMPRGFHHPGEPLGSAVEMWGTFDIEPGGRWYFRGFRPLQVFARLAPGATIESARAELSIIGREQQTEFPEAYPASNGWVTGIEPLRSEILGTMEQVLLILFGAVGFVLLVACTNVAALLITRGAARSQQTAVRMALGASRGAVMRFQLAESVLLSVVGGFVSFVVAAATTGVLAGFAARYMPRAELITIDWSVLAFALLVAAGAGMVFGMAPAISASFVNPLATMNESFRGSTGKSSALRDGLVVGEVAVSVILVVASGLLIRSFDKLMSVDMGFDPTNVKVAQTYLPVQIDPNEGIYRQFPARVNFYNEVIRRLEERPDVSMAGGISHLPLREVNAGNFIIQGDETDEGGNPNAEFRMVSHNYFEVMSIPLLQGRHFTELDLPDTPGVVIVNQAWVDRYAGGRDPLGLRVSLGNNPGNPVREIVGVVGNVKMQALDTGAREAIYAPYRQVAGNNLTFVVRSEAPASTILEASRDIIASVDPDQPAFGLATMDQVVAKSVAERQVLMWMVSLFGVLALVLAGLGVYGVVSFRVRQRRREIGIRLALGAKASNVVNLVLADGMKLGVMGVVIGVAGALFSTKILESMLYGVERFDPLVLAGVSALGMLVAVAGALLPARRATTVDPLETLKAE